MRKRLPKITEEIRDNSVAQVVSTIRKGLRRGVSTDTEECIEYVENNRGNVSMAYFEAARHRGVFVSRDDTETGYSLICLVFEKELSKIDRAYATGFGRSGRAHLR